LGSGGGGDYAAEEKEDAIGVKRQQRREGSTP
jgi:hypothetical protein